MKVVTTATQEVGTQNRVGIWTSILYVAISGNLFIALSPIFWGGYSDYLHLSDAVIGDLMSTEFFGQTAAGLAAVFYLNRDRLNLRNVIYVALAFYVIGNYATPRFFHDLNLLKAVRFVCGFSAGTTFMASSAAITALKHPSRLVAVFYGAPYFTGFIFQPMLPTIFSKWGFNTSFTLVAVAAAASGLLWPFFPKHAGDEIEPNYGSAPAEPSRVFLVILSIAVLLQYVANSGIWLFFERIGILAGHDEQTAANIVGLGTGMSLIGTALATLLAQRLNPLHGVLLGSGVMILSTITLHFSASLTFYAGSVWVFNMMVTFLTPYYFILLTRIFHPAKAVTIGNTSLLLGFSLGPLLIGYTVDHNQFGMSINATIGVLVLSIALVLIYAVMAKGGRFVYAKNRL